VGEQPAVLEGNPASNYWKTISFRKSAEAASG